jgi:hypothetical protein
MMEKILTSQQVLSSTKAFIDNLSVNEQGELVVTGSGGLGGVRGIYAEHNFNATVSGQLIPLPESGVVFLQFWGTHADDVYLSTKVDGVLGPRARIEKKVPVDIGPLVIGPECPNYISGIGSVGTVTIWIFS